MKLAAFLAIAFSVATISQARAEDAKPAEGVKAEVSSEKETKKVTKTEKTEKKGKKAKQKRPLSAPMAS